MESLLEIDNRLFGEERKLHPPCKVVMGEYILYPSDKGYPHTYLPAYSELFEPIRNSVNSVLEIGIAQGGSLALWNEYFYNANLIFGMDYNGCSAYDRRLAEDLINSKRNSFVSFDNILKESLSKYTKVKYNINLDAYTDQACSDALLINNNKKYDIIIDDGSHSEADMFYFIENYGLKCLNPGGLLIIEDCNLDSFQNMSAPYNYEFFGYKGLENLGYPDNMFIIRKLGYE